MTEQIWSEHVKGFEVQFPHVTSLEVAEKRRSFEVRINQNKDISLEFTQIKFHLLLFSHCS